MIASAVDFQDLQPIERLQDIRAVTRTPSLSNNAAGCFRGDRRRHRVGVLELQAKGYARHLTNHDVALRNRAAVQRKRR